MKHPGTMGFQPEVSFGIPQADVMPLSGTYCPIIFFDIAAFGDSKRDNDVQISVRNGLYQILARSFDHLKIRQSLYYRQDCGDGVLMIFPPTLSTETLAFLPAWLAVEIQRHNKCASPAAQIQLRAALHVGPVHWDAHGVCGQALIHAARLIEAQPPRDALAAAGADLVFIVSESVYDMVIQHTPHPAGTPYRQIRARVKESAITAWITLSVTQYDLNPPGHHRHRLSAVPGLP